jgi:hypothetical protein
VLGIIAQSYPAPWREGNRPATAVFEQRRMVLTAAIDLFKPHPALAVFRRSFGADWGSNLHSLAAVGLGRLTRSAAYGLIDKHPWR